MLVCQVLGPSVCVCMCVCVGGGGIGACMLVCVWYTELTCLPYWASKTDIVCQVLGPSMCVSVCRYRCVHACVCVVYRAELYTVLEL